MNMDFSLKKWGLENCEGIIRNEGHTFFHTRKFLQVSGWVTVPPEKCTHAYLRKQNLCDKTQKMFEKNLIIPKIIYVTFYYFNSIKNFQTLLYPANAFNCTWFLNLKFSSQCSEQYFQLPANRFCFKNKSRILENYF